MDPVDPDAGLDPVIFVSDLQGVNLKLFFLPSFFAYYFLKVHLYHFFKDKKSERSYKPVGINVFLTIFV
jgi:hypothetical protein